MTKVLKIKILITYMIIKDTKQKTIFSFQFKKNNIRLYAQPPWDYKMIKNNANQPLFPLHMGNGNQQYIHSVFMCIFKKLHCGAGM